MEESLQTCLHEHCAQVVTIMPTKAKPPCPSQDLDRINKLDKSI